MSDDKHSDDKNKPLIDEVRNATAMSRRSLLKGLAGLAVHSHMSSIVAASGASKIITDEAAAVIDSDYLELVSQFFEGLNGREVSFNNMRYASGEGVDCVEALMGIADESSLLKRLASYGPVDIDQLLHQPEYMQALCNDYGWKSPSRLREMLGEYRIGVGNGASDFVELSRQCEGTFDWILKHRQDELLKYDWTNFGDMNHPLSASDGKDMVEWLYHHGGERLSPELQQKLADSYEILSRKADLERLNEQIEEYKDKAQENIQYSEPLPWRLDLAERDIASSDYPHYRLSSYANGKEGRDVVQHMADSLLSDMAQEELRVGDITQDRVARCYTISLFPQTDAANKMLEDMCAHSHIERNGRMHEEKIAL